METPRAIQLNSAGSSDIARQLQSGCVPGIGMMAPLGGESLSESIHVVASALSSRPFSEAGGGGVRACSLLQGPSL